MKWKDIRFDDMTIRIERAVTHRNRNQPLVKATKTEASMRVINLVLHIVCRLEHGEAEDFVVGGREPLSYSQVRRMCERIQKDTGFEEAITLRLFRTTVPTVLYDAAKDIKQHINTEIPIAIAYEWKPDAETDFQESLKTPEGQGF